MKTRLIKIVASLLLVACLATPALAVAPLVLTAAELIAPSIVAAGITYLLPKSATSNMPKTGYADNYGVKRNMLAKVGTGFGLAVTAAIAYSEMKSLIGNPTTPSGQANPVLSNVLYKSHRNLPDSANAEMPIGQIFEGKDGSSYYKATGSGTLYSVVYAPVSMEGQYIPYVSSAGNNYTFDLSSPLWHVYTVSRGDGSYSFYKQSIVVVPETDLPPPVWQAQPDTAIQSTLNSPTLDELYPQYVPAIDSLFSSNPSAFQMPPTLSSDILDAQKQVASDTLNTANSKRVESLRDIVDSKQATFDANPTQENLDALNQAKADLAEAEAEMAEDELTEAEKKAEEFTAPATETPALHQFDFTPLVSIGSTFAGKFPFSLVSTCASIASGLVSSPTAPSFTINFPSPFNYAWVVSLSSFDNIAVMIRFLVGAAFLVAVSMTILRRWV
jgi:hypothetical protein